MITAKEARKECKYYGNKEAIDYYEDCISNEILKAAKYGKDYINFYINNEEPRQVIEFINEILDDNGFRVSTTEFKTHYLLTISW
jgi:hypothetical protein